MIEVVKHDLPSYWAYYLVYGDASGLEPGEEETIKETLVELDLTACLCVGVTGESSFSWDSRLGGGDYVTYIFHRDLAI